VCVMLRSSPNATPDERKQNVGREAVWFQKKKKNLFGVMFSFCFPHVASIESLLLSNKGISFQQCCCLTFLFRYTYNQVLPNQGATSLALPTTQKKKVHYTRRHVHSRRRKIDPTV
jgi:hypothetical protein